MRENNDDDDDDDDDDDVNDNVNNEDDDDDDNNDAKLIFMMRLPSTYSLRTVQASFEIGLRNAVVVVDAFVSNLPSSDVLWSPC